MCKRSLSMLLGAAVPAILTALAPIAVLIGSSPAHADPDVWDTCSVQGAKIGTTHGALECMRLSGQLRWMQIEPEVTEKPPGYPAGSCRPSANPPPSANAVASEDCVNNTLPDGPPFARYEKFADQNTLDNEFQTDARGTALQPCPGSNDSAPATWNAVNPPPATGSVMCYTSSDNMAHVEWTNTTDLVRANASGPDMASLYGWWHGLLTTP